MRDNFGIGFALERPPTRNQAFTQRLEILDDAVVNERDLAGRMRMRVAGRRRTVGGPAGMRDADIARRIVGFEDIDKVRQLPLRATAYELAVKHGADTRRVIPPILHPLQPIDQPVGHGGFANNSNNSAHAICFLGSGVGDADTRHLGRKILCVSCDEDGAVYLCRRKNIGIKQLYPHSITDVRRSQCDPRVEFDDLERCYNLLNLIAALERFSCQNFGPDNPAYPVPRISREFVGRCLRVIQPVDNNVGIKKRIGHRL